ncbi:hypothetical protein GX441_03655 [bacterium]|nr:hypothetical protein [bacterium]
MRSGIMVKSWSKDGQIAAGSGIGRSSAGSACIRLEAYSFGRSIEVDIEGTKPCFKSSFAGQKISEMISQD